MFFLDKKLLALFLLFVVLTTLVPFRFAQADDAQADGLGNIFRGAIKYVLIGSIEVVAGVLAIGFMVIQFITGVGPLIGAEYLSAVIKFTQDIALTPAHANPHPALLAGWQFTRNLANMAFILILAWAAFATILRRQTYEVRKILPKLLIIALLINFIPVITGVILDITGIITSFFVAKSSGAGQWLWASNPIKTISDVVGENWKQLIPSQGGLTGIAAQSLAGIIFNIISFGILIGYALVFLIRVVAIWILIILAPLAWLGYILPAGKRWWNMWWNQFILWAIIGIPMLFFLYIAGLLLQTGMTTCTIDIARYDFIEGVIATALGPMLCNSFAFIAAIAILIIGMGLSVTLAPRGASGVLNLSKKGLARARRAAATQTVGRFTATQMGQKWLGKAEKFGFGIPAMPGTKAWKEAPLWKKTVGVGLMPVTYPLRWGTRQAAKAGLEYGRAQPKLIDSKVKALDDSKKYYKDAIADYGTIAPYAWQDKLATVLYATQKKGAKALNEFVKKYGEDELKKIIKIAGRYAPAKVEDIVKHMPNLIDDKDVGQLIINKMVSDGLDDEDVKKLVAVGIDTADAVRKAAFKKAVDALKPADIETLDESTIKDTGFQEMVVRFKDWSFIRRLIDERGMDYGEKLQDRAEEIGIKNILKSNPTFVRASVTPAGQIYLRNFVDEQNNKIENRDQISGLMNEAKQEFRRGQDEAAKKIELAKRAEEAKSAKVGGTTTRKAGGGGGSFVRNP